MVRHKSPPARRKFARLSWPVFAMCGLSLLIFSYFLFLRLASKPTLVRQFAARLTVPLPNNATLLYYDNHVDVQCPGPDGVFLVARETGPCVGLNHYVANLRTLLREAYASDRVAVLKPICLCSRHNGMRRVRASWDRYINLDAFGVRFINPADDVLDWVRALGDVQVLKGSRKHVDFDRVRDSRARAVVRVLPDEREFVAAGWGVAAEENRRADGFKPRLEESVHIHNAAMAARAELDRFGPSFVCVRARRGDKLKGFAHQLMYPCLSKCTRPANIAFVLKAHSVPLNETVYLMSDEKKPGFFEPLRTEHGFTNLRTMKDLVNIKDVAKFDNFFAFAVEQAMCRHARGVIGTFHGGVGVLSPYKKYTPTPMDFHGMLTPYTAECNRPGRSKKDKEACSDAYHHYPLCARVVRVYSESTILVPCGCIHPSASDLPPCPGPTVARLGTEIIEHYNVFACSQTDDDRENQAISSPIPGQGYMVDTALWKYAQDKCSERLSFCTMQ